MSQTPSLPESSIVAIEIASVLAVKPADILKYLHVSIGSVIQESTVLAKKGSLFGKVEVQSPVAGVVENIDNETGSIIIRVGGSESQLTPSENLEPEKTANEKQAEPPQEKVEETTITETEPTQPTIIPKPAPVPELPSVLRKSQAVSGLYGFKNGRGLGEYLNGEFTDKMILPEMKEKILLLTQIPNLHQMFKASAVGVAGVVVAGNDLETSQSLENELAGKAHISFLLLPAETNLKAFHNKQLQIQGEDKLLITV